MTENSLAEPVFSAVLDTLIPPRDAELPGAGALGLGAYVEERLGAGVALVAAGLEAVEALARERGTGAFADLPEESRAGLLTEAAGAHPGFAESLLFHLYTGYYLHPRVVEALGLESRPPHPGGYELERGDLDLLDPVRERTRFFRET